MNMGQSMQRHRSGGNRPPPVKGGGKRLRRKGEWKRSKLLRTVLALVFFGWTGGYLLATQVVFPAPDQPDADYVVIPDLRGLSLGDAEEALRESGFTLGAVDSVHHPDASVGVVIGQGPLPGQLGIPPDSVRVAMSLGSERRPVPEVVGLPREQAVQTLRASGFTVRIDSTEAEVPKGEVVSTSPRAGTQRAIPSEVRLVLSLGPPAFAMPHLIGLEQDRAFAILDSLGLVVVEVGERSQLFNPREIVEQSPAGGTEVTRGGEVRLIISRRMFF